jgi:hypothetical protein
MRAVHLGYPRISPRHFDLVVPTPEYPVPDAPNVARIPFALSPHHAREVGQTDRDLLATFARPIRLLLIGGPTLYWELSERRIFRTVRNLLRSAAWGGGSVIAVGSPRTPPELHDAVECMLEKSTAPSLMAPAEGPPSYAALIDAADEIYVTADSVAMVADAVMTRKPVGIVPISKSSLGKFVTAIAGRLRPGKRLFPRDLRFFWASLAEHGFAGTIDDPRASDPPDFTAEIADRVRRLLKPPVPQAKVGRDSVR